MKTKAYNKDNSALSISAEKLQPGISVDCVVFGFHEGTMKILLNKFNTHKKWMLPGGFVAVDEDVNAAATRILTDRTGLTNVYLTQFYLFGDVNRTSIEDNIEIMKNRGYSDEEIAGHWSVRRFVSVGYFAFVDYSQVIITPTAYIDDAAKWFDMDEIPELYSDHNQIIEKALSTIRTNLANIPIGMELLPEKFTMTELRLIYECILGKKLDRRNFQRQISNAGIVEKLDEVSKRFGIKTSTLFSFNRQKYEDALKKGLIFFK